MIRGLPVALTGWSPGRTRGASGGIRETITRRSRSVAGASGDAWRTRTTSGKMVSGSALGTGVTFRRMVRQGGGFGRGFERRHSARVQVGSGRLIGRASGTRVSFRKVSGRCGASAGFQKGGFRKGLLRRVAQGR